MRWIPCEQCVFNTFDMSTAVGGPLFACNACKPHEYVHSVRVYNFCEEETSGTLTQENGATVLTNNFLHPTQAVLIHQLPLFGKTPAS
jgi:hypothetical protein